MNKIFVSLVCLLAAPVFASPKSMSLSVPASVQVSNYGAPLLLMSTSISFGEESLLSTEPVTRCRAITRSPSEQSTKTVGTTSISASSVFTGLCGDHTTKPIATHIKAAGSPSTLSVDGASPYSSFSLSVSVNGPILVAQNEYSAIVVGDFTAKIRSENAREASISGRQELFATDGDGDLTVDIGATILVVSQQSLAYAKNNVKTIDSEGVSISLVY